MFRRSLPAIPRIFDAIASRSELTSSTVKVAHTPRTCPSSVFSAISSTCCSVFPSRFSAAVQRRFVGRDLNLRDRLDVDLRAGSLDVGHDVRDDQIQRAHVELEPLDGLEDRINEFRAARFYCISAATGPALLLPVDHHRHIRRDLLVAARVRQHSPKPATHDCQYDEYDDIPVCHFTPSYTLCTLTEFPTIESTTTCSSVPIGSSEIAWSRVRPRACVTTTIWPG